MKSPIEARIVSVTEALLTWRRRRILVHREKQKSKGTVRDWLEAILSAVVMVLLINQYLLQAYQIPSGSMIPTLLIADRIFVNKLVYGPELVPGAVKLPGPWEPQRGDIVIFESPEYLSRGPIFDVVQRVIYMVTLALVDIDKDENGKSREHFLVKRAVGLAGDRIRMNQGNVEILTPGESSWIAEADLKAALGLSYRNVRTYSPGEYADFRSFAVLSVTSSDGLAADEEALARLKSTFSESGWDEHYRRMWADATTWAIAPDNAQASAQWRELAEGVPVPPGHIFPMGDNRDNSYDARYFGPVSIKKVLGKGLFRYWPLHRIGILADGR